MTAPRSARSAWLLVGCTPGWRANVHRAAQALSRLRALPDESEEFEPVERERLLADFLDSPEGQRWRGNEDAEDAVATAIDFGCDYNHGGPLRWSPVVVEIFMTSWLTRKVVREPEFFRRVPDVLPDWVAYAGRRRKVPAAPLREAVGAVKRYRNEMLAAASDSDAWARPRPSPWPRRRRARGLRRRRAGAL